MRLLIVPRIGLMLLTAVLPLAARARAEQDAPGVAEGQDLVRVEVRVTAVLGDTIYLDRGADAGLRSGDRLTLRSAGRPAIDAELTLVTRVSARATLFGPAPGLQPGDLGEVVIPATRLGAAGQAATVPGVVWEHPPEDFDPARPLLTPGAHTPPAERPLDLSGRAYAAFDLYSDEEEGGEDAWLARTGFDATLTNPFGRGGVLDVRVDAFSRQTDFEGGSEELNRVRIDRLSYRIGNTRDRSTGFALGRFLHSELPELGLIDGVEVVQRRSNGDRFGASFGFLPEYSAELETGDDLSASVFYRGFLGSEAELSYAGALQKTWHRGDADRDLAIASIDWAPGSVFSLHGGAWVDLYSSDNAAKDSGPELTELQLDANWRFEGERGFGLSVTHVKWPDIEREDFPEPSLAELSDGEVSRVGGRAYTPLSKRLQLRARADLWEDQDESGAGGEVELARRSTGRTFGEVALAVFANEGKFVEVQGARLTARRRGASLGWRLSYEAAFFDTAAGGASADDELQHLARLGLDRELGRDWSFSVDGDYRFGDDQSGFALGLFLSRRF